MKDFKPGLEGVVAVETEVAKPDVAEIPPPLTPAMFTFTRISSAHILEQPNTRCVGPATRSRPSVS